MKQMLFPVILIFLASCTTTRYYIVRHGEKGTAATMSADVPLSEAGEKRAKALRERLRNSAIQHIYSTDYQRTRGTAAPLAELTGIGTVIYDPKDTAFINRLRTLRENALVVGHSNTVDDIVNGLMRNHMLQDLQDSEYGDLFIVKKRGKKFSFEKERFGE